MPRVVPEYKEEARSRILDAANQVFAEKGYRQATMDDVAKKLGVSKGALYLYFASKEDLFEEICRTAPAALKEILYSSFSEKRDPVESANEFFDKMVKHYGSNPGLSFEILSEASHNPGLRRILKKNQDDYAEIMTSFLEQLRKMRVVGDDLDLRSLAHALVALWNGMETILVAGLPAPEARRAWLEALKAMFMHPPTHQRDS